MIFAAMASIPERVEGLRAVVESVYPQVDQLNVFLDRWSEVPPFLIQPKIHVERSQDRGPWGDAGKFFWCDQVEGIHLTLDDDMFYPSDYVEKTIASLQRFEGKVVGSYYGKVFDLANSKARGGSWGKSRLRRYTHIAEQLEDAQVHIVGTAFSCYQTNLFDLKPTDFIVPNMADVWLGLKAQELGVPLVVFAHERLWIRNNVKVTRNSPCIGQEKFKCLMDVLDEIHRSAVWAMPPLGDAKR